MPNRIRLTDIAVRALKYSDDQITYWDDTLPAFGVRVGNRSKTFIVVQSGGRRLKIGSYPQTSLHDARQAAKLLLATPAPPVVPGSIAVTVSHAVTIFLETRAQKNRPSSKAETERLLRRHFLPKLSALQLTEITTDHVTSITDGLKDTPAIANNAFAAMRTFFNWSVARRYLKHSPAAGLSLPAKINSRNRVLTDTELVTVHRAASELGYPFGHLILICIHTGMRRGEMGCTHQFNGSSKPVKSGASNSSPSRAPWTAWRMPIWSASFCTGLAPIPWCCAVLVGKRLGVAACAGGQTLYAGSRRE